MKATGIELLKRFNEKSVKIVLTIPEESAEDAGSAYAELMNAGELEVTIKKFYKKRSLDANAYCWKLLGELAEKLDTTAVEIYRNFLRDYGIYKDFLLTEEEAKTFFHLWKNQGVGWVVEKLDFASDGDRIIYRAFYGSSVYNTKQMSRLLNAIVEECKQQGIETKTPEEIANLKSLWKAGE